MLIKMSCYSHILMLKSLIYLNIFTIIGTAFIEQRIDNITDYCRLECKNVFTDTVSQNSACDCSEDPKCGFGFLVLRPTEQERADIVLMHNKIREKVANGNEERGQTKGGATDILALAYDYNLEHVAECWAIKCVARHDECRSTERYEKVGQNFFSSTGQLCDSKIFKRAINAWYEEISGITLGCVLGYGACMSVGHYTQLVWAKTAHVGCTRVQLSPQTCHIFCNYGPTGNIYGQALYTIGPAGIHCAARDKVYRSLCASRKIGLRANDLSICSIPSTSRGLLLILLFLSTLC